MRSGKSAGSLLLMCAMIAGCATPITPGRAPERTVVRAEGDEPIEIPSRWCGSYIVVDIEVNGFGPLAMLLDTGSDATVFDVSLADRLPEAVLHDGETVRGAEGEELEIAKQLRVDSLRVGGMELGGFDAVLFDLTHLGNALGEPIDGVMGFQSFYDVLLTVDYPERMVRVQRGTLAHDNFFSVMPMRGPRTPSVPIEIGDQTLYALIDTAGTPALTLEDWSELGIEAPPTPIGTSVSIGGVNVLERGRLAQDVTCGVHTFVRPLFSPTTGGVKLGTDMLEPFSISFDQRARLVRFDRPGVDESHIAFPAQRGFGVGFDREESAWTVLRVFDGGPKGLRTGDRVVSIDRIGVAELGCGVYRSMMEERASCVLRVERDGSAFDLEVPLLELVR